MGRLLWETTFNYMCMRTFLLRLVAITNEIKYLMANIADLKAQPTRGNGLANSRKTLLILVQCADDAERPLK